MLSEMGALRALPILCIAAFVGCKVSPNLVLAERGKAPDYTIVLAERADACERFAASELQSIVKRQTGVELPIVVDGRPAPKRAIVLRKDADGSELGDEGFSFSVEDERLYVRGGRVRGVLFGVYELLERFGGCAWYSSWHEVVPSLERFSVPRGLSEIQKPAFDMRVTTWYDFGRGHETLALRNRLSSVLFGEPLPERYGPDLHRFDSELGICHTFRKLLPVDKWFDTHPEYFSEIGGRRIKDFTQLCLTNPDVVRLCTEAVLSRIRETYPAGCRIYGVSQDDWVNWCTCEKCKVVNEAAGSNAGTLVDFVNAIAAATEREFPDVLIETLVYQGTRHPPKTKRFRKNVLPCFCTSECDFSKAIPESRAAENVAVREMIRKWGEKSERLLLWDYTTAFDNYLYTWPNVKALAKNIRYYRDSGVKSLMMQGDGQGLHADWGGLKGWLVAKLMWNPDLDLTALLDRYFLDNFGPAAKEMRRYFEDVHAVVRDERLEPMTCFEHVSATNMQIEVLDRNAMLLATAAEKTKGFPEYERNVHFARLPLDFTRALKCGAKVPLKPRMVGLERARFLDLREGARRVVSELKGKPGVRLAERSARNDTLVRILTAFANRSEPPDASRECLAFEEDYLGIDTRHPDWYRYVGDPAAEDGSSLWLSSAHYNWSGLMSFDDCVDYDPDCVYRLRMRIRVKKDPAHSRGEAVWAGVWNPVLKKASVPDRSVRVEDLADEGYHWYDVGEWKPKTGDCIWVGPGRFTDGCACHAGVWVDKLEVSLVHCK